MSSITELKEQVNTKTTNFVLLSIATAGIYLILWLFKNSKIIASITKKELVDDNYPIYIAVCVGLGGTFQGSGVAAVDAVAGLLSISSAVLYILWAFRAKTALQEYATNEYKIDLRMNGFYTFLFNVYYINYCINDLAEIQSKQNVVSSSQTESVQS
ncbi:hypothetical protein NI389_20855 (plasmid) [Pseudoalteromonas xiamenensis]|uniref:hypothetical protein n=1 Tax=Pseudoalteromonas xiamenensis TaxID=882626 RepID=UPI0027E49C15|nr:hypothetical protein [Pseudoalteromonas xiamenensis]WMN61538.1 hypothetical protein NI389_17115 [Pseudoalteromonas xiamenensis]WMN62246.1 hypothetical protein NI389_20855 [Pseudoalteromonas xiamenensis]